MQFFKNSVSFLAVLCVLPGAFAATPRVSVSQNTVSASRRLPTLMVGTNLGNATGRIVAGGTATNTVSSNAANLLSDTECIDAYTSCMKSDDACGSEFENCTTNVLFHGAMPQCFSVLYQCSASGIDSLFGTSNVNSLSNNPTKNQYGEVTRYAYPTNGSVMGQAIIGSAVRNKYDTANCVKKYKSCLFKDSVCGEEFELCTTDNEFKKQSALCDSVLGRCDVAGIKELFGENVTAKPTGGAGTGVVHEWLDEGADLAASNAVQTCYKVVDNCFLNACKKNPYRCVEGSDLSVINTADLVASGNDVALTENSNMDRQTAADVKKFFKSSCLDTIGTNKYCYMTFREGQTPKKSDLVDVDNQEDIFSEAYSSRKSLINSKLQDLITSFDTKAKSSCVETIKSCAMRSCAGGSGAACYVSVFGADGKTDGSIAGTSTYNSIKNGCAAIVNTDLNCKYAAATYSSDGEYNYSFNDGGTFETLFPTVSDGNDPIGAIAALNSSLATNYNSAAIAQKKKQCQNLAANCVKSMCGNEYTNCYRNRTDVSSTLTKTGISSFDKSMNKVGGVLDYTIALGLCLNTVKTSEICEESLAISKNQIKENDVLQGWGEDKKNKTVSQEWSGAGSITHASTQIQQRDANGKLMCTCANGDVGICGSESGGDMNCTNAYMIDTDIAVEDQAANTLFKELIVDIEKEAQAIYNAKLTAEQNLCYANNNGGIVGKNDFGSRFMWVKLKNGKVPTNYGTQGLTDNQFVSSNDLYGSFCRGRIELRSSDKDVQDYLSGSGANSSVRYFAVGDSFTCGSWLTNKDLENITNAVGKRAREQAGEGSSADKWTKIWTTVGGGVLGGVGAGFGMDALQTGDNALGRLINPNLQKNNNAEDCLDDLNNAKEEYYKVGNRTDSTAQSHMNKAVEYANKALSCAKSSCVEKGKTSLNGISFTQIEYEMTRGATQKLEAIYAYDATDRGNYQNKLDILSNKCLGYVAPQSAQTYVFENKSEIQNWIADVKKLCTGDGAQNKNTCKTINAFNSDIINQITKDTQEANQTALDGLCTSLQDTKGGYGYRAAGGVWKQKHIDAAKVVCEKSHKIKIVEGNGSGGTIVTDSNATCAAAIAAAKSMLDTAPDSPVGKKTVIDAYVSDVVTMLNLASSFQTTGLSLKVNTIQEAQEAHDAEYNWSDGKRDFESSITEISNVCNTYIDGQQNKVDKTRVIADGAAAVVGGTLTGLLGNQIVRSAQEIKYEKAEQEAIQEWMKEIGSKIKCYIGEDEISTFGQTEPLLID